MNSSEKMIRLVRQAKQEAEAARSAFDAAGRRLELESSRSIGLYDSDALDRVSSLIADSKIACDQLYSSLQGLVLYVDREARPLLAQGPAKAAVKEVAELISWLNEESEIENNVTASLNGDSLGGIGKRKYLPSVDARMIEKDWDRIRSSLPGDTEEDSRYARQCADEERLQQQERTLERLKQEAASEAAQMRQERKQRREEKEKEKTKQRSAFSKEQEQAAGFSKALSAAREAGTVAQCRKAAADLAPFEGQFRGSGSLAYALREEADRMDRQETAEKELLKAHRLRTAGIWAGICCAVLLLILVFANSVLPVLQRSSAYRKAGRCLEAGDYDQAIGIYEELGGYKDSAALIRESVYRKANALAGEEQYREAISLFLELGDYEDSAQQIGGCWRSLLAKAEQAALPEMRDAAKLLTPDLIASCPDAVYCFAVRMQQQSGSVDDLETVCGLFEQLGDYQDSLLWKDYTEGIRDLKASLFDDALTQFEKTEDFLQTARYRDEASRLALGAGAGPLDRALLYYEGLLEPTEEELRCLALCRELVPLQNRKHTLYKLAEADGSERELDSSGITYTLSFSVTDHRIFSVFDPSLINGVPAPDAPVLRREDEAGAVFTAEHVTAKGQQILLTFDSEELRVYLWTSGQTLFMRGPISLD